MDFSGIERFANHIDLVTREINRGRADKCVSEKMLDRICDVWFESREVRILLGNDLVNSVVDRLCKIVPRFKCKYKWDRMVARRR